MVAEVAQPKADSPARRRFLRFLLGFSALSTIAMVAAPIVGFLVPPKVEGGGTGGKVLAGTTEDIALGTGKVVPVGSKPVIVTNTESGITAFSAVCTHLGCIVGFDSTVRQIVCPCHDGHFNPSNGAVVSGPPPRPLQPVAVSVEKDQIFLLPGGA
jgi:cytochrome b6-f complex iron-sulfur subunit